MAIERVNSQHLWSTEGFKIFENTFCSNFCGLEEHAIYQNIFSYFSQVKDSPPLDKLVIILGIEIFLVPTSHAEKTTKPCMVSWKHKSHSWPALELWHGQKNHFSHDTIWFILWAPKIIEFEGVLLFLSPVNDLDKSKFLAIFRRNWFSFIQKILEEISQINPPPTF